MLDDHVRQFEGSFRLLVLDDEDIIIRSVQRAVRSGFQKEVQNGELTIDATILPSEAIAWLSKNQYQVVITDYQMPQMRGDIFLSHVKEHQPLATRILMSGSHVRGGTFHPENDSPPDGFPDYAIEKPFDTKEFVMVIRQAFNDYAQRSCIREEKRDTD